MKHSIARIMRVLLIAKSAGSDHLENDAWPIFITLEPDQPDDIITLYNTVGNEFGRIQLTGERIEHPGFQVMIRCADSEQGWVKAKEIERILNEEVYRDEVSLYDDDDELWTYRVHSATQRSLILPLGREPDNSERYLFSINYTVTVATLDTGTGT